MLPPQGFVQELTGVQEEGLTAAAGDGHDSIKLDKSNIILLGPTGCGMYFPACTQPATFTVDCMVSLDVDQRMGIIQRLIYI